MFLLATAALIAACLLGSPAAIAAPGNDDFANAKLLRVGKTLKGSVQDATRQPGEPRHAKSRASHSVWYRLRVKRTMTVAVNTCRTSFDTVLAAYTGRSLRRLKPVQYNDNGCSRGGGGSRVSFQARRGVTYRIAVAGVAPKRGFHIAA